MRARKASGPVGRSRPVRASERVLAFGDSVASALTWTTAPSIMPYFWKVKAASLSFASCFGRTKPTSSFEIQTSARSVSSLGTSVIRIVPGAATVPGVRRAQLEQLVAVLLLRHLLVQPLRLGGDFEPLGLQLAAVVGADLRRAL